MMLVRQLPLWARVLALVGLVAALFGFGYVRGAQAELQRFEAAERKAAQVREDALNAALKRGREAARQYLAYRLRAEEKKYALSQAIRTAPTETLYRTDCSDDSPQSDPVRVTWDFVRLWDGAAGEARVSADPGGTARTPSDLSPLGPRDLLANHAENTASCEIDRERYRQLIAYIRVHHQQETQP